MYARAITIVLVVLLRKMEMNEISKKLPIGLLVIMYTVTKSTPLFETNQCLIAVLLETKDNILRIIKESIDLSSAC